MWALETVCADRHVRVSGGVASVKELSVRNRERLLILAGEDGRGGTIGELVRDAADTEQRMRTVEKAVIKGQLVAGIVAAVGAAVLSWLLNHM